jgi:hypothetical protein
MRVARVLVDVWLGGYSLVVKWGVTEDDGAALRLPMDETWIPRAKGDDLPRARARKDELVSRGISRRIPRGDQQERARASSD